MDKRERKEARVAGWIWNPEEEMFDVILEYPDGHVTFWPSVSQPNEGH